MHTHTLLLVRYCSRHLWCKYVKKYGVFIIYNYSRFTTCWSFVSKCNYYEKHFINFYLLQSCYCKVVLFQFKNQNEKIMIWYQYLSRSTRFFVTLMNNKNWYFEITCWFCLLLYCGTYFVILHVMKIMVFEMLSSHSQKISKIHLKLNEILYFLIWQKMIL